MTGEARDNDPTGCISDDHLNNGANIALMRSESGNISVGRVDHKEIDSFLAEASEGAQVSDANIER